MELFETQRVSVLKRSNYTERRLGHDTRRGMMYIVREPVFFRVDNIMFTIRGRINMYEKLLKCAFKY